MFVAHAMVDTDGVSALTKCVGPAQQAVLAVCKERGLFTVHLEKGPDPLEMEAYCGASILPMPVGHCTLEAKDKDKVTCPACLEKMKQEQK